MLAIRRLYNHITKRTIFGSKESNVSSSNIKYQQLDNPIENDDFKQDTRIKETNEFDLFEVREWKEYDDLRDSDHPIDID